LGQTLSKKPHEVMDNPWLILFDKVIKYLFFEKGLSSMSQGSIMEIAPSKRESAFLKSQLQKSTNIN